MGGKKYLSSPCHNYAAIHTTDTWCWMLHERVTTLWPSLSYGARKGLKAQAAKEISPWGYHNTSFQQFQVLFSCYSQEYNLAYTELCSTQFCLYCPVCHCTVYSDILFLMLPWKQVRWEALLRGTLSFYLLFLLLNKPEIFILGVGVHKLDAYN